MEKIIESLNLKTLNLVNRNKIKYEERPNGVKKWSFHTTVSNTECYVEIFSHKEYIQIYIHGNIIWVHNIYTCKYICMGTQLCT